MAAPRPSSQAATPPAGCRSSFLSAEYPSAEVPVAINAEAIRLLIENELASISEAHVVAHIRGMLVEPHIEPHGWDTGGTGDTGQQYWMVLKDPNSVVEIV